MNIVLIAKSLDNNFGIPSILNGMIKLIHQIDDKANIICYTVVPPSLSDKYSTCTIKYAKPIRLRHFIWYILDLWKYKTGIF